MNFLADTSVLIVVGPGGVGKTTIAAALGVAAARAGIPTGVITIDPAQRLRDVLEIRALGAEPRHLSARHLRDAGLNAKLPFAALALDVKRAWDELLTRTLKDPERRQRMLENPFYRELSSSFAGAENYAALDCLINLRASGRFSMLVVDTPPAQHTLDFLAAPDHLTRLLDSPTARWLTRLNEASRLPGFGIANSAGRFVLSQLEAVTGRRTFSSMLDFLETAAASRPALSARMREARAMLSSSRTSFVIVTTPAADRLEDALSLAGQMQHARYRVGGVVLNRASAELLSGLRPSVLRAAREAITNMRTPGGKASEPSSFAAMLKLLDHRFAAQQELLSRVRAFVRRFPLRAPMVQVPEFSALRNLDDLVRIAALFDPETPGCAC